MENPAPAPLSLTEDVMVEDGADGTVTAFFASRRLRAMFGVSECRACRVAGRHRST